MHRDFSLTREAFSAVWLPFLNKRQTNVAGGNKKIHEHPTAGTSTFANRPEDINREGRPVSIRNQLKRLLEQDGKVTVPSSQVDKVNDDGSVTLVLPTQDQLAMKLLSWALSKKGVDSIKAIQMVMEQIDGKPKQEVDMTSNEIKITRETLK